MTQQDSNTIRQLLTDILSTHTAEIDGKFNLIKQELNFIKEQTTKTNGRVTKHDEIIQSIQMIEKDHFIKCPNTDRLGLLEDSETARKSVYRFIILVGSFVSTFIVIVIAIIELIIKRL